MMRVVVLLVVVSLLGCEASPPQAPPPPASITSESVGYYCGMTAGSHIGPKGQIHLSRLPDPLWFTSVRDAIAFTRLPDEAKDILAIYVNDMGRAEWDRPSDDSWMAAERAWYVVGSRRKGGMGAAELVPFGQRDHAEAFVREHGGRIMRLDEIPDSEVLGS